MEKGKGVALYDVTVDGQLIYVGISSKPRKRLEQHKGLKSVPPTSVCSVVAWYETRELAMAAEKERIKSQNPPLNPTPRATEKQSKELEVVRKQIFASAYRAEWERDHARWNELRAACEKWTADGNQIGQ